MQTDLNADDYQLSADHKYVAFRSNYTKQWRHSFNASYTIYDLVNKRFIATPEITKQVQYFAWAPEGNRLAFVWENDVYVKSSVSSLVKRVTSNGKYNLILNGVPDWVYEEEMFSSNQALWWSPGGKHVAYAEFNEMNVHAIEYSWYGDDQYPSTVVIPYPKPGTPNPVAKLFVVDADNAIVRPVAIPPSFNTGDHYLATVTWVTDNRLAVQWLKRKQEELLLQIYDFSGSSWTVGEKLQLTQVNGWIGRFSPAKPVFAADNSSYYLVMSDREGYKHIHHVVAGTPKPLTSGAWEVMDILKVTADDIVLTAQGRDCLTCKLYEDCQYNAAYFSHSASFYRMACYGPGTPRYTLRNNNNGTEVKVLEDNNQFINLIADIQMPTKQHGTIKLKDVDIEYQMILPPGFSESKQYPLLVDVYAGPCSQKADYRYRVGWSSYLASTENIIVASFDGRGSGYRGDKLMHAIYRRLGTFEVEDQITAVQEIMKRGFIDKQRIAIWGWSYGGYVTSMALGAGSGVFKCGMAVAPVSKWEYYGMSICNNMIMLIHTIYTERYMNQPNENREFYENSTVTARAKNFHSVQYLLVHGTADDNVHFQQAAQISKALVDDEVDFEAMWYTDKDHGLGGFAYEHVHTHMTHFLLRCFA
ncbi:Dipeptidyl peptidase 4 [Merluccius polli]|uniref:Dipeptidyl peptidase 4 n=1 Tax=Merluccius polli TaxID=89951 RepID=A0AA47P848_MERPO|nr:Dipeptidyl peptidase 4 [Merluccius polli]